MDLEILVSASDKLTEELEDILGGIRDLDQNTKKPLNISGLLQIG